MSNKVVQRQPFMLVSVPKAGTHLLLKAIQSLPGMGNSGITVLQLARSLATLERSNSVEQSARLIQGVPLPAMEAAFDSLVSGQFGYGHLWFSPDSAQILDRRGIYVLLMVRDPRDLVVSHANAITKKTAHYAHQHYVRLSWPQRVMCSITGILPSIDAGLETPSIRESFERFLPWASQPRVYMTSFEKLVGPQGGGDRRIQLEELNKIVRNIGLDFSNAELERVADNLFGGSPTFFRGHIGSWKEHFTAEHVKAFKEVSGDLLVDLGYETSLDW
jgi:sulfotransferase 6B1